MIDCATVCVKQLYQDDFVKINSPDLLMFYYLDLSVESGEYCVQVFAFYMKKGVLPCSTRQVSEAIFIENPNSKNFDCHKVFTQRVGYMR